MGISLTKSHRDANVWHMRASRPCPNQFSKYTVISHKLDQDRSVRIRIRRTSPTYSGGSDAAQPGWPSSAPLLCPPPPFPALHRICNHDMCPSMGGDRNMLLFACFSHNQGTHVKISFYCGKHVFSKWQKMRRSLLEYRCSLLNYHRRILRSIWITGFRTSLPGFEQFHMDRSGSRYPLAHYNLSVVLHLPRPYRHQPQKHEA